MLSSRALRGSRPVLLLCLGQAPEPVSRVHGSFPSWYERAWGSPLSVHDGRAGLAAPDPRDYAGLVITGSASSLTEPEPWMEPAAELAVRAHDVGVPVLGVCFGHQLLGAAFGGRVVRNPRGWEIGTTTVEVDPQDRLFAGLPRELRVNMVHQDIVTAELPDRVKPLGGNELTEVAVLAVGEHVRGVQFHPEVTGPIVRGYIDARRPILSGLDPDLLISQAGDAPDGVAVLANFRRHFVDKS